MKRNILHSCLLYVTPPHHHQFKWIWCNLVCRLVDTGLMIIWHVSTVFMQKVPRSQWMLSISQFTVNMKACCVEMKRCTTLVEAELELFMILGFVNNISGNSVRRFGWCWIALIIPRFLRYLCIIWVIMASRKKGKGYERCCKKSSEPKGYNGHVHSGFVCAAYLNSTAALAPLSVERRREKVKIATTYRGLIWDSACGTRCLFNLVCMWILRVKYLSNRQVGPLVSWCQTGQSALGPGILVPSIWAIFVPRLEMLAFCPLCYWCRRVLWSISTTCYFTELCTCISWSRQKWLSCTVMCNET